MRILFVTHLPWVTTLGAVRQQVEVAEAFEELGHVVEHLAGEDIGYRRPSGRVSSVLWSPPAARSAVRATRRRASRFDVVEGHQGLLPVTRQELGGPGLLVMRSAGLATTYHRWRVGNHGPGEGHPVARPFRRARASRDLRIHERSYRAADLALALNGDEVADLRSLRTGRTTLQLPIGLPRHRLAALAAAARPPAERLASRRVVFVGYWSARKGSADWRGIIADVWSRDPDVTFRFLGTNVDDARLASDLGADPGDPRIEHVPRFVPDELPSLLAACTVAVLPSYIEGYGIVTAEAAAAGIPTIAYDTSGTREFPSRIPGDWLVPAGDAARTGGRILRALQASPDEYEVTSSTCRALADEHGWDRLGPRTAAAYEEALGR